MCQSRKASTPLRLLARLTPHHHVSASASPISAPARRTLSTTTPLHERRQTRQRQAMNRWIEGPGAVFKRQREDSTNYLGAYDKAGRLIRASESRAKERELQRQLADPTTETERAVDAESELEEIRMKEEDEKHKEAGRGGSRDRKGAKGGGKDGGEEKEVPPETIEDLLPFPLNPFFRSQSVLSEALRDEVYRRVVEAGQTVREVSQALSITMERVGAVVRLKTIENDWSRDNKPLAHPYAHATQRMLPQTPYEPASNPGNTNINPRTNDYVGPARHESINDLPVHRATLSQLFDPVPESRHYTRADAGRAFARHLKPADDRIPHPDMIATEAEKSAGLSVSEREERKRGRWEAEVEERAEREVRERVRRERGVETVGRPRWDFRIKRVDVEEAGKDGRGFQGVGWRYGQPLPDRKKGMVWIPTEVES